jgi:hypothetical protein
MTSYTRTISKVVKIYIEDMKYDKSNGNFKNKQTIFQDVYW